MRTYSINKGINSAIEFRGLKAQYIGYLVAVVVGSFVGFGLLHATGLNDYISTLSALGLGGWGMARVFRMSRKYGQYGLMKRRARRGMPVALLGKSRLFFVNLYGN